MTSKTSGLKPVHSNLWIDKLRVGIFGNTATQDCLSQKAVVEAIAAVEAQMEKMACALNEVLKEESSKRKVRLIRWCASSAPDLLTRCTVASTNDRIRN